MKDNIRYAHRDVIAPALIKEYGYTNPMAVPKIVKVTLNMGVGDGSDKKLLAAAVEDMTTIAGQQAVVTKARKSIAGFKIRQGWPIGCKVTLRGARKEYFMHRLINIVLPRVRDFRGFSAKAFDGRGNYTLGVSEQIIFPEIDYDKVYQLMGMDICITTSAKTDEDGYRLLKALNFPFNDQFKGR